MQYLIMDMQELLKYTFFIIGVVGLVLGVKWLILDDVR